jgi:hypothetical protein
MIRTPRAASTSRLALVLALAALAAGCATPQPQHRHRREGGWRAHGASLFVSPFGQPFRAGPDEPYPVARWFAQADENHDGKLTLSEFRDDAIRYFHKLDLNGDGVIDGQEVTAYEHDVLPELLATPQGQGGQGGGSGGQGGGGWGGGRHGGHHHGGQSSSQASPREGLSGAAAYTLNRQAEPVSSADADFDGRITLAEFLAAADRHFDELDTQRDGYLTLAGLPKTAVQLQRGERHGADHD